MVTREEIQQELHLFFDVQGQALISAHGVISVEGTVWARRTLPYDHIPLQFGHITHNFVLFRQDNLKNLQGCPHTVLGDFKVIGPNLTDLTGAPRSVGKLCSLLCNNLKNLENLPDNCGKLRLNMTLDLPLLRLTESTYPITWGAHGMSLTDLDTVSNIINKYRGTGRPGALKAAVELIRAGFKNNAKW